MMAELKITPKMKELKMDAATMIVPGKYISAHRMGRMDRGEWKPSCQYNGKVEKVVKNDKGTLIVVRMMDANLTHLTDTYKSVYLHSIKGYLVSDHTW
jgi:hypothetical protein